MSRAEDRCYVIAWKRDIGVDQGFLHVCRLRCKVDYVQHKEHATLLTHVEAALFLQTLSLPHGAGRLEARHV